MRIGRKSGNLLQVNLESYTFWQNSCMHTHKMSKILSKYARFSFSNFSLCSMKCQRFCRIVQDFFETRAHPHNSFSSFTSSQSALQSGFLQTRRNWQQCQYWHQRLYYVKKIQWQNITPSGNRTLAPCRIIKKFRQLWFVKSFWYLISIVVNGDLIIWMIPASSEKILGKYICLTSLTRAKPKDKMEFPA